MELNARASAIQEAREECQAAFNSVMPAFVKWIRENPNTGDFPMPSLVASNMMNKAADNVRENSPVLRSGAHSSASTVSGMLGGSVSTLAELEAITVTN